MFTYHMPKETKPKKQTYNDAVKLLQRQLYYTVYSVKPNTSYTYLKDTQVCHFGIFFW